MHGGRELAISLYLPRIEELVCKFLCGNFVCCLCLSVCLCLYVYMSVHVSCGLCACVAVCKYVCVFRC